MSDELPVMTQAEWADHYNAWVRGWRPDPPNAVALVDVVRYDGCVFFTNPAPPTNSPTRKGNAMPMTPDEIQRITELSIQVVEITQALDDELRGSGVTPSVDIAVRAEILRTNLA